MKLQEWRRTQLIFMSAEENNWIENKLAVNWLSLDFEPMFRWTQKQQKNHKYAINLMFLVIFCDLADLVFSCYTTSYESK